MTTQQAGINAYRPSDTLEDVESDDPPPVSMISTSFMLSSPTPTVSIGLVASLIVVPFISSPSPSPPGPLLIIPLEPGCDLREEELAEEVLTIKELQQYFPALHEDTELSLIHILTLPTILRV